MLRLGDSPQLNSTALLEVCADKLSASELATLTQLSLVPDANSATGNQATTAWNDWETCLRNRLALRRGTADNSADDYLRHENDFFSEIDAAIQEAVALGNPLECERHLDALRWRRLDDMESGKAFSFDALCVYMVKLQLLEKWLPRDNDHGYENLDLTITGINNAQQGFELIKNENS